ncbi:TetR/AcrR family transcriptional regulator [Desulfospira joergensenii]|uniref:TetR/AcrR family transcriptional regulator n=1 Tax=Desulfospira joergensenii TaxID=53329 RepID=UPI0003B47D89|nr:TetR/AcrR family transcriptional regulator [Desulfospira joergensenii]
MQVQKDEKRLAIIRAAAELFASQPFHKVTLSDVATLAAVGKGTLYTYFKSKDDLYLSMLYIGFERLVDRIRQTICLDRYSPRKNLAHAIGEILGVAYGTPYLYEVLHRLGTEDGELLEKWQEKRRELKALLEEIIVQGIENKDFYAPNPELTACIIPGIIRSAVINAGKTMDQEDLTTQVLDFTLNALRNP